MKFPTQYTKDRGKFQTEVGDRFKTTYQLSYDDNGSDILIETGKIDIYEEIQSYKDSCDIKVLLERYSNGDSSALNARPIFYGDVSDAPSTLAGHLQLLRDAEAYFDTLNPDIRSKFNNSVAEFYSQIGTPEFYKSLGIDLNKPSIESDVKEDESVDQKSE